MSETETETETGPEAPPMIPSVWNLGHVRFRDSDGKITDGVLVSIDVPPVCGVRVILPLDVAARLGAGLAGLAKPKGGPKLYTP